MKPNRLVGALAVSTLIFAALMPPEAYPAGKMAVIVCATFAFLGALTEKAIPNRYALVGLTVFGLLVLHTSLVSVDRYRSFEFIALLWAYYCLAGFFIYSGEWIMKPVAVTMVSLAAIVSIYGLYQYFWGFDQIYQYIFYSGSDQVIKAPALGQIATRRVFSTLALPGTLWGFLVMALPFHAMLWRKHRLLNAALTTGAALILTAGFLTRSFGFLAGLLVLVAGWLAIQHRRVLWNRMTVVVLLLMVIGGTFYSARRDFIQASNPFSLRFRNWVSAWHIFAVNPAGTGLNTYGVTYPQYMLPGANETQYAHNTFLQMLSELGYPFLLGLIALLVAVAVRVRWKTPEKTAAYLLLAFGVWVLHNMIDIDVYFGSLGVLGAVVIGLLFSGDTRVQSPIRRSVAVLAAIFGCAVVAFSGFVLVSDELQHRAQVEYENNKPLLAIETLEQAKAVMPWNSSLYFDSGEILLDASQKFKNPQYLARATDSFRRAIDLSPNKVGPHIGLGLCLSQAGSVNSALSELAIAHDLYPRSSYVQSIIRLLEQRKSGS